ncbi:CinA family protein [Georgenia faecalis]|uniref:CinA family protein n=1 Tax=Georgenia faecalis TaxID=2483799 RepID=A0ABV9DD84_9MICO|nr:CinA family protein [Georgenia faecalis]
MAPPRPVTERVLAALAARGGTLALAESLTGGDVTARLVAVPGASAVLRGGVVPYATDLKAELLGVDADLLAAAGPVDARVAAQMAQGAARRLGADHAVATTGVAGPGPADGAAAGTVYVAACAPGVVRVRRLALAGTRPLVRRASGDAALALLAGLLADGEHLRVPGRSRQ